MRKHHDAVARAKNDLAGHRLSHFPSRSWLMRDPAKGGTYAFSVTWKPGALFLAGDIGEMTIQHNELRDLWRGILWMYGSDFDYIMGKSNQKEVYDVDATFDAFMQACNEDAVHAMKERRDRHREYRRDLAEARKEFEMELAAWEARELLRQTRCHEGEPEDPKPVLDDFMDRFVAEPEIYDRNPLTIDSGVFRKRQVPEGWHWWDRLRDELDVVGVDENDIFTAAGRREIKDELRSLLEGTKGEEAYRLASSMGLDDFGPQHEYTWHHRFQFEALQLWARTMLEQEPVWHRAWRWMKRKRALLRSLPDRLERLHFRPVLVLHQGEAWWSPKSSVELFYRRLELIRDSTIYAVTDRKDSDGKTWTRLCAVKPWKWRGRIVPGVWTETGAYVGSPKGVLHPVPSERIATLTTNKKAA